MAKNVAKKDNDKFGALGYATVAVVGFIMINGVKFLVRVAKH